MTDVLDRDAADALQLHRVEIDAAAKGDGGHDRQLVPGIDAAHVKRRVGFEVAKLVGLRENVVIG